MSLLELRTKYYDDPDELILAALREKSLSTESLALLLGTTKQEAWRRLRKLATYNEVEKSTTKATFWWRLKSHNGGGP